MSLHRVELRVQEIAHAPHVQVAHMRIRMGAKVHVAAEGKLELGFF